MMMLLWATSGASDATKASIPLHVAANGCLEVGHETGIILAGDAAELVIGNTAETMQGVGIPPVSELLAKLREHSVPVYV